MADPAPKVTLEQAWAYWMNQYLRNSLVTIPEAGLARAALRRMMRTRSGHR